MITRKGSSWLCGICGANQYEEIRQGIASPFPRGYQAINGRLLFGAQEVFVCPNCAAKEGDKGLIFPSGQGRLG